MTASRTKVTPSGIVAWVRIRQTATAPVAVFPAAGKAGSGSLLARASSRCAM